MRREPIRKPEARESVGRVGRSTRGRADAPNRGRANPMSAARSLTRESGFSRSDAEIPRGSLDTVACSDMLEMPKSAEISRVFGPSASLPPETGGFSARWEMRPLRSRPGTNGEQDRGSSWKRATPSEASRQRVRSHEMGRPTLRSREQSAFGMWSTRPLEIGDGRSDVRSVGGTSLAARVMQLVPRFDLEPVYGEGAR
jgi:hypothetical protein